MKEIIAKEREKFEKRNAPKINITPEILKDIQIGRQKTFSQEEIKQIEFNLQ